MRFPIYSLLIPTLLAAFFSTADAHEQSGNTHARRALSNKLQRRQLLSGITGGLGDTINGVVDGLGLGGNNDPPAEAAPTTTRTTDTSTSTTDSTTSVLDATSITATSTSTSASASSTSVSETSSTVSTTSTTKDGGILSSLTSILLPGPPTTTATSDTTTSVSPTDATSAPTPTSTSADGGILSSLTSILLPPSPTPTSSDSLTDAPTSVPTSAPTAAPTTSSSSDDGGILSSLTSILLPGPPSSTPSSQPPTSVPTAAPSTSDDGGIISSLTSILLPPSSTPSSLPPTSVPTSISITDPPTSIPTSVPITDPPTSVPTSSIIISFPTSVESSSSISGSVTPSGSEITSQPTPTSTISINSDLSFVLTESSLIFASIPTSSVDPTLTDPDAATTTVNSQVDPTPATTLSVAPLPTGIPGRIYPKVQLDMSQDLSSYTMISILFNQELNWPFVVNSQISSSQIFAWLPAIIATALVTPAIEVKTWALQVYVPASYRTPADAVQLGTMWLGYIPSDQVDTLAAQIKAKQSLFYNGIQDNVAKALASHVNSGFSLNAVADPNLNTDGAGGGPNGSGTSPNSGKSRQDAIIGVVSALGAIALLVLVFLVYRSMKRRRELAHRRLSDPPNAYIGARPDGREFDQDSMGAPRRRSFYFAEDSLRGFQGSPENQYSGPQGVAQNMMQRRNVMPAAISAPVLQESSMNW